MAKASKVGSALVGIGMSVIGTATAQSGWSTSSIEKTAANNHRVSVVNLQQESRDIGRMNGQQTTSASSGGGLSGADIAARCIAGVLNRD